MTPEPMTHDENESFIDPRERTAQRAKEVLSSEQIELSELLQKIDADLPEQLMIWNEQGNRDNHEKEFKSEVFGPQLNDIILQLVEDPTEQENYRNKISKIYQMALRGLRLETFEDWGYDPVPAGLVDRFFCTFPKVLTAIAQEPQNREFITPWLDLLIVQLANVRPLTQEDKPNWSEFQFKMYNNHIPFDTTYVCDSLNRVGYFLSLDGKSGNLATSKNLFLNSIAEQSDMTASRSGDLKLYGEKVKGIIQAVNILDQDDQAITEITQLIFSLEKMSAQLFVDFHNPSVLALARIARKLEGQQTAEGQNEFSELIKAARDIIVQASRKKGAGIIFVQEAFTALNTKVQENNLGLEEIIATLKLTAQYLLSADMGKEDKYGVLRYFLREQHVAFLLHKPRLLEAIFNQSEDLALDDEKLMTILDFLRSNVEIVEKQDLEPLTEDVLIERFFVLRGMATLPAGGVLSLRRYIDGDNLSFYDEHKQEPRDPWDFFLDYCRELNNSMAAFQDSDDWKGKDQFHNMYRNGILSAGLDQSYFNLVFGRAIKGQPTELIHLLQGFGIFQTVKSDLLWADKRDINQFIQIPETKEGQEGIIRAVGKLGEIYSSLRNVVDREQIEALLLYILRHPDLMVPFLFHLHNSASLSTLNSLSWMTRLANADENLEKEVNTYLSENLSGFSLPEPSSNKPQLSTSDEDAKTESKQLAVIDQVNKTTPLGAALTIITEASGHDQDTIQNIVNAMTKVDLRRVEDIQSLIGPIIEIFIRQLNLDRELLQEKMFTFKKASEDVKAIYEEDAVLGFIAGVSAMFGGGPIAPLAYDPVTNEFVVNEEHIMGHSLDGVGEEVMHWVRATVLEHGADYNPVVQEFWGFLGKRLARKALHADDYQTTPESYEDTIMDNVREILGSERYGYIDIGYKPMLRNRMIHVLGYVAASNVPLELIDSQLIRASDEELLTFIQPYLPNEQWFKKLEGMIEKEFEEKREQYKLEKTALEDVMIPIKEVLVFLNP